MCVRNCIDTCIWGAEREAGEGREGEEEREVEFFNVMRAYPVQKILESSSPRRDAGLGGNPQFPEIGRAHV